MGRYRDIEFAPELTVTCPRCGATSGFKTATVEEDNSGGAMFMLGGLLPYLLYKSSRGEKLYCDKCHYVFKPKEPWGSKDAVIGLVILAVVAAFLAILTWR